VPLHKGDRLSFTPIHVCFEEIVENQITGQTGQKGPVATLKSHKTVDTSVSFP